MKPARIAVLVVATLSIVAVAGAAPSSAASGPEIVAKKSARNRAAARHDAVRRLGLISLPPGAILSPGRPSGIGDQLTEPAAIPGGTRYVSEHRFWTLPGSPRRVYEWLDRHPPRGTSARENHNNLVFWESGPPGTLGATGVVAAVQRSGGGTAVRVDVFDGWELPRDPIQRIPMGAGYLTLEVVAGSGGFDEEGEAVPPIRRVSTSRGALITALVGLINRQPAYQLFELPSCGPQFPGSENRLFIFRFRDRRHGRLLARVSQKTPIVLCQPIELRINGLRPYSLERGRNLIHRAHDLIQRAQPVSTDAARGSAMTLIASVLRSAARWVGSWR